MAYDPEARSNSNSAMIIGIVVLVVVIVGGIALFAMRDNDAAVTPSTVVVDRDRPASSTTVINNSVPAAPAAPITNDQPDTVVVNPPADAPAAAPDVQVDVNASTDGDGVSAETNVEAPAADNP